MCKTKKVVSITFLLSLFVALAGFSAYAAVTVPISGEIQLMSLNDPTDAWSAGVITVGGQNVIIPRNLLMDLPANRLTLQQLFAQAPAQCVALGQSGLAKGDTCNPTGTGAFATISANRTNAGDVIAGDVFIEKGRELVSGIVTYIDYTDGYIVINGLPNDPATGAMIRLNDPDARHSIQQGLGCLDGPNCSADPRFTLDPDNYVITFTTGYPACIPSTVSRTFADLLGTGVTTSVAAAGGTGDYLCPETNRPGNNIAADSRRFAPIMIGDSVTAEGNFEIVNGVQFLSAYALTVNTSLGTGPGANQPDYLFMAEVEIDAPGFENERARTLFIGFATLSPADVLLWTIHYDPVNNAPHEFPLGSVRGCDIVGGGAGTCSDQGIGGGNANGNIFKIRYDIDFIAGIQKPEMGPCAVINADGRFPINTCASASLADNFAVLSPIPHEIMTRTGKKFASLQPGGTPLVSVDISGNEATNGQYLFPLGANLGGIAFPEFVEIDLNAVNKANPFSGIPWNLDRRLSPGGCDEVAGCEGTPQPLDPFPFEGYDPRFQAAIPLQPVGVSFSNNTALPFARDRIISYVSGTLGKFDGPNTLLAWPPTDPPFQGIQPTIPVQLACDTTVGTGGAPAQSVTLSALPALQQTVGGSVTFTAANVLPPGNYEYRFRLRPIADTLTTVQPYSTSPQWIWDTTGATAGDYIVAVDVRTLGSTGPFDTRATLRYTLTTGPATSVTLTSSLPSPQIAGTPGATVTFTAENVLPAGGNYLYRFRLNDGVTVSEVQPYSANPQWVWDISAAAPGTYRIRVDVRSRESALPFDAAAVIAGYVLQ